MSDSINVVFQPSWSSKGEWYSALELTMTNHSGKTLANPTIAIELSQPATASSCAGFTFSQEGQIVSGTLLGSQLVADGASVTFSVGLNFPEANTNPAFPKAYFVDGLIADSNAPIDGDDEEETPIDGGDDEETPIDGGDEEETPVDGGDEEPVVPVVPGATTYAPYVDVSMFAVWGAGNYPAVNTQFVSEALALGCKKFHLAFLVWDKASSQLCWGNSYFPMANVKPLVDIIQQAGGEAIFAFGGLSGTDPSVVYSEAQMLAMYLDLVNTYGIKHIDLDFETIGAYNYQVAFKAAKQAQRQVSDLKFSLTPPVMPTGLTAEGVNMMKYAASINFEISVQIMAMDYGPSYTRMGDHAIEAVNSTHAQLKSIYPALSDAQLYNKIGVTPMLGQNDIASEVFTLADADKVGRFAKEKGLSLVGSWALGRDFPRGGLHSDVATCTMVAEQTENYQFLKTILKALA